MMDTAAFHIGICFLFHKHFLSIDDIYLTALCLVNTAAVEGIDNIRLTLLSSNAADADRYHIGHTKDTLGDFSRPRR